MSKLPESARKKLLAWIDSSGFSARGVVVDLNGTTIKLREPRACFQDADYVVVAIETGKVELAGNYKQVASEAGLSLINCSAAVIVGVVTFGSTAASPFTGGTSLAILAASYAATVATSVSCAASVYRTYNALTDPKANHVLDNSPAYQTTMKVVDGISLLGVGTSAVAAVKTMNILKRAGVSMRTAAKGMVSRQARAKLAREFIRANRPGISNVELKEIIRSGAVPKRLKSTFISQNTVKSLRDSIAAGLSFLSSVLDGNIKSIVA